GGAAGAAGVAMLGAHEPGAHLLGYREPREVGGDVTEDARVVGHPAAEHDGARVAPVDHHRPRAGQRILVVAEGATGERVASGLPPADLGPVDGLTAQAPVGPREATARNERLDAAGVAAEADVR